MSNNVTSLEQSFSKDVPAGGALTTCPNKTKSVPTKECDIEMVEVTITRKGKPRIFTHPSMSKASGKLGGTVLVDVLSNPRKPLPGTKPADTSTIKIVVKKYATCSSSKHPLLTVQPSDPSPEGECKALSVTTTPQEFQIFRKMRPWEKRIINGEYIPICNLIAWLWDAIGEGELGHVEVIATSCGVRKAGAVVQTVHLPIRVYPVESYSVTLSIPPLWSKTVKETHNVNKQKVNSQDTPKGPYAVNENKEHRVSGYSSETSMWFTPKSSTSVTTKSQSQSVMDRNAESTIAETQRTSEKNGSIAKTDRLAIDGEMGKLTFSKDKSDAKPWERIGIKLAIKREGSDLNFEVGEFLTCVVEIVGALKKFRDKMGSAIQGEVSIGLTLTGEINILAISLSAEWARKDTAGPRAPWDVKCSLSGKIIDASLTAKYGLTARFTALSLEIINFEVSASLTFKGTVAASIEAQAEVLDGVWKWMRPKAPIKGNVKASLVATGTAKVMGKGCTIKAEVSAGITVNAEFVLNGANDGPIVTGDIVSDAIEFTAFLENTISHEIYESPKFTIVEEFDIVKGFKIGGAN